MVKKRKENKKERKLLCKQEHGKDALIHWFYIE
jgi:hypothetical protein